MAGAHAEQHRRTDLRCDPLLRPFVRQRLLCGDAICRVPGEQGVDHGYTIVRDIPPRWSLVGYYTSIDASEDFLHRLQAAQGRWVPGKHGAAISNQRVVPLTLLDLPSNGGNPPMSIYSATPAAHRSRAGVMTLGTVLCPSMVSTASGARYTGVPASAVICTEPTKNQHVSTAARTDAFPSRLLHWQ